MLHFTPTEFARRMAATHTELDRRGLDGLLCFAPESQFWLTGHDTFGFCFFQCLIIGADAPHILVRSADLIQAELTSNIQNIHVWTDGEGVNPAEDLKALVRSLGLAGKRLGIEMNTHGLTARNWQRVDAALDGVVDLVDASDLVSGLRLVKSEEELVYVRRAAQLADDALDAGLAVTQGGANEADILNAMQGAVFAGGGDYPGNEFIVGSGDHALLCRYQSGRRVLDHRDQITLEWAGAYRHYHAAMMRTVVIGAPDPSHLAMQAAAEEALLACEAALKPGAPMAEVFDAHVRVFEDHGLGHARLNACGYSLGARFAPSWMEDQMFYAGASTEMAEGMVFFLHMILMNREAGTANCLGRTSLITANGAEPLSRHGLDLICR